MLKRILILILICSNAKYATAQHSGEESDLKAAFIYNFTKYIDWDTQVADTFSIGVVGISPVYNTLQEIAQAKTINGAKIVILHFNTPGDITPCNILFIAGNSSFSLSSVLARTGRGTLTIGEEPGFAEMGTAFNFVVVNDKLKFEANLNSINRAGLKASSQLLKLAIIVN